MLSSYPVSCPYEGCGWGGNLVPSLLRGGADAEIGRMQRAWFHCPACQRDWEVRISDDRVSVVPAAEPRPALGEGRKVARRKDSVPMAKAPDTQVCPQCGCANRTAGMKTLQVEMRPVLTPEVFAFPDALAEVNCLKCAECGHWMCLDYRIELDDNPEIDLNPE
jgi:hypothetical protein